jgi:hypothetical protein
MDGLGTDAFIKKTIEGLGSVPDLIHPCPYKAGIINVSNIELDVSKMMRFPLAGIFKVEYTFYTKKKTPFFNLRVDEEITSSEKKSGSVDKAPQFNG